MDTMVEFPGLDGMGATAVKLHTIVRISAELRPELCRYLHTIDRIERQGNATKICLYGDKENFFTSLSVKTALNRVRAAAAMHEAAVRKRMG